ncbi:glucose-1-phosphate adenylyltransferase family protein [Georgenia ruanii]|uniref:Glucose-1-phosphate adenylyltransferase n=1 Tax=Georgenia ruanii TaxID=348442 RepID=A0A7J9UVT4_9MICO|nr:sugar phosphate nucleotidyltransferase [Georgenia ruanii]MPV88612.1 glucose-1-phosphate adenylyltransferase [Georgenia ruanii]
MAATRTLLIVLAGGAGAGLETLTEARAVPALRFAGSHRLIDFPLSNARNSGLSEVWVLEQHHPGSLAEHLGGGRPWDLDRTRGGLRVRAPQPGGRRTGSADALWRVADAIEAALPEVVLVAAADAVYRMDYAEVVGHHLGSGAELTLVTTRHDGDRSRLGVVTARDGVVTDYAYRPTEPAGDLVTTGVLAFDPRALLAGLEQARHDRGTRGLGDVGEHLLPTMVRRGVVGEYRHAGSWQPIATVEGYWRAHMDLLAKPPFGLDDPAWPISTCDLRQAAVRVQPGAELESVVLAPGVVVQGTVRRSVLGPGVHVAPGAVVEDAVLLDDVRVGPAARVSRAVVDEGARVRGRAEVGGEAADDEVALVGADAVVHPRKRVPAGGRYPAGA